MRHGNRAGGLDSTAGNPLADKAPFLDEQTCRAYTHIAEALSFRRIAPERR